MKRPTLSPDMATKNSPMLNINFTFKEISLLAKLAGGYRKSQEGQRSNKVEWAKALEQKLVKAETASMEVLTTNLKQSYDK